ncbi:Dipeptidyl peptidase family member 6 [Rhynchospora pubera]|uniref:Dipeptidyl peptidase family member 6 n=2 Tax=Rhynchospora pubera TaxID=906938 RepID=A0AAV8DA71_9POAL|nr:Dipeptidyl peptidase family member 6 [Rhynchospora pubera]
MASSRKTTAPYGSWKSPITSDLASVAEKRLSGVAVADDGRLIWVDPRPHQGGRAALVMEPKNSETAPMDLIPESYDARTRAQEYGGGAFAIKDGILMFSNYKDQRLYKHSLGGHSPVALTPDYGGPLVHYADGIFDPYFNRYITVMEDCRQSSLNPTTTIATISLSSGDIQEPKQLIIGSDFYAFPRVDPSRKRMAWIEWSHPNMPWDRSQLWLGCFSEVGEINNRVCIAGNDPDLVESPTEPKWSPSGELFFLTDRNNGYWNIYRWVEHKNEVVPVYSLNAEFTRPQWIFGIKSYDFFTKDGQNYRIVCSYRQNGRSYLGIIDYELGSFSPLDIPFSDVLNIVSGTEYFYLEGASPSQPLSIAKVTLEKLSKVKEFSIVWSSSPDLSKYKPYFSFPEVIKFPTEISGQSAYAYFYPPLNADFQAPLDERPPLVVRAHGGPTGEARAILDLYIQFWTSRGWGFLDVNYGGSTGYGRAYRERLLGQWGIVDVNDCCSCAKFLVEQGKVDGERLCITGRSAGGFTTLACLAFKDTFKAGASLFGVADLSLMSAETHKLESHYIKNLVGNEKDFLERSPINSVHKISQPVILFQGLDDKVVPPDQSQKIYNALKEKGVPVALVEYEGEQHGFRKAENIKFTYEQQMMFFSRLVGHFDLADNIIPIKIENFD